MHIPTAQNCDRCKIAGDAYIELNMLQGFWVANNSLDLAYMDLSKSDSSKDSKENVLVITNDFSHFNVMIPTPNQKVQPFAKVLADRDFMHIKFLLEFTLTMGAILG